MAAPITIDQMGPRQQNRERAGRAGGDGGKARRWSGGRGFTSAYILKVKLTEFPIGCGDGEKEKSRDGARMFLPSTWQGGDVFQDVDRRVWREMFIPSSHLIATGDVSARAGSEERTPDWRRERVQPA